MTDKVPASTQSGGAAATQFSETENVKQDDATRIDNQPGTTKPFGGKNLSSDPNAQAKSLNQKQNAPTTENSAIECQRSLQKILGAETNLKALDVIERIETGESIYSFKEISSESSMTLGYGTITFAKGDVTTDDIANFLKAAAEKKSLRNDLKTCLNSVNSNLSNDLQTDLQTALLLAAAKEYKPSGDIHSAIRNTKRLKCSTLEAGIQHGLITVDGAPSKGHRFMDPKRGEEKALLVFANQALFTHQREAVTD